MIEFVAGKEHTVDVFCRDGQVLMGFVKTREAIRGRLAMYFETVNRPDFRRCAEKGAGLFVTPDDPTAHADAILWLYHHPEGREALGARGRAWVAEKYTWEQESKVLLRFYEQILKNRDFSVRESHL